ncbi:hypothetical protein MPSEU_000141300 [Mayamaea pseudoterrestris]|nr:hypothetical protein MPSEU_000141300 [Mayamaea pseudoterrestris]
MASLEVAIRGSHNSIYTSEMEPSLEMDAAAHALLGVTPSDDESFMTRERSSVERHGSNGANVAASSQETNSVIHRRPRSDSAGLDALADLASLEQSKESNGSVGAVHERQVHFMVPSNDDRNDHSSSEDSNDSNVMPPPPLRRRRRSASNPEGMDKWDPRETRLSGRRHFVLPASILEEELAEVSEAMKKQSAHQRPLDGKTSGHSKRSNGHRDGKGRAGSTSEPQEEDEVDEASLTPDELLRRARSRLLEDLSYNLNGEKGELTFPHTLEKYQDIYNMNGRIGIYTAAERAAIIARFQRKRSRRVWNKKIRYGCRKSLADRRLRVKGRFVKRSEQEHLARLLAEKQGIGVKPIVEGDDDEEDDEDEDKDMFDVDDPDAGFSPTEDSPYRRLRRHTIT